MLRFLIDECCTPLLADDGGRRGYEAVHVCRLGLAGISDRRLAPLAVGRDYVLVTNNRRDFVALYRDLELHPGLLVILPSVGQVRQCALFAIALDAIEARGGDIVNMLVEVATDGRVTFSPLP